MTPDKITDLLRHAGVSFVAHEHVAVGTIAEAREQVPHLLEGLIKTVVFEVKGSEQFVLVAVDHAASVDYRAVAAAAGCSRRALRLVPGERVAAELGFEVGGVGPFRVDDRVTVLFDAALPADATVRVGAGLRTRTLELALADLIRLSSGRVVPASKPGS